MFQNNVIVNGDVYANNFYNTSDYRIKDVLSDLDDERDKIDLLRPVKYQNLLNKNIELGFIAHELQKVIPSAVNYEKDALTESGNIQPQSINVIPIISVLTGPAAGNVDIIVSAWNLTNDSASSG